MKIQDFTGGLNNRLNPQFLGLNEGQQCRNVDTTVGSLTPLPGKTEDASLSSLDQYFFWFQEDAEWVSNSGETSYVEDRGRVYWVNGSTEPKVRAGGTTSKLGIDNPTTAPTVATGAAGVLTGTYSYVMTYYNSTLQVESGPTPISADIAPTAQQVQLTGLDVSADPQVDQKRIYRVGGAVSSYLLVNTITNATTVYVDNKADDDLGAAISTSDPVYLPAENGFTHIAEYNGMLFAASGNDLRFTPVLVPTAWPATYSLKYPRPVIGSAKVPNGLLVLTDSATYLVTGTNPDNLASRIVDTVQGCTAWQSIREFGNIAVWTSKYGICVSSGGEAEVISRDKLGPVAFAPLSSAVVDRVYYLLNSDGVITAMDSRYSLVFYEIDADVNSLASKVDELYGWTADAVYKLLDPTADPLSMTWESPHYIEGGYSELKGYKKVYAAVEGTLTIKIYLDGVLTNTHTVTDDLTAELAVTQTEQRGSHISFVVTGTGTLHELEWMPSRRGQ